MESYEITIFTPTYNRAYTLDKLYKSLLKQNMKKFEWIIVDDGSSDNTKQVVENFIVEKRIDIKYINQKNQGKHVAINKGLEIAKGELFFVVDSDDYLIEFALDEIIKIKENLKREQHNVLDKYCGIAGLKVFPNYKNVGTTFKGKYKDTYYHMQNRHNIKGDKAYIFFTDIFKQYPYPVFDGEKHTAPSVSMVRMSRDGYKIRYVNKQMYICEYLEDGLSKQGDFKLLNNFEAYTLRTRELIHLNITKIQKVNLIIKYCYLAQIKNIEYKEVKYKLGINNIKLIILWNISKMFKRMDFLDKINKLRLKKLKY